MEDNFLVPVRNRNNGFTGYTIADKGIWRNFAPNERKQIPFGELKQLQYQPGGDYTLKELLVVENAEALRLLNIEVEQEYNYTEADIRRILLEGSIDELKDFLDFAPDGAIEIAKKVAVEVELPDIRKRDIISEATEFNITNAINVNHIMDADEEKAEEPKKERRVKAAEAPATKQRRASTPATPNYKVIDKK